MACPNRSKAPSPFLALPTELRLQIYNYLLPPVNVMSYYINADLSRPHLLRHGISYHDTPFIDMLFVNRQLHAEYVQALYERTDFFLFIDASNHEQPTTSPWAFHRALLPNLRECQLRVRLVLLEPTQTLGFPMEEFFERLERLLERMERVRWVRLEWSLENILGVKEWWGRGQLWQWLGEPFVHLLKGVAGIREITVMVQGRPILGSSIRLERKGAEWVEREVVP